MKKQNTTEDLKPTSEDVKQAPQPDEKPAETEVPELDAKAIARQRSKDDLARKRRNIRNNKGKW
jgi:hypothetical protein